MEEAIDYVFGYGSIINNASRRSTLQCLSSSTEEEILDEAVFATLSACFGYRRCWCYRSSTGFTALGLKYCGDEGADGGDGGDSKLNPRGIGGVLFPIPNAAALTAFDLREAGYHRVQIPAGYVTISSPSSSAPSSSSSVPCSSSSAAAGHADLTCECSVKSAITHCKIWIYIPDTCRIADPDENFPLLQTYIDTCVRGCLEWGGPQFVSNFLLTTSGWNEFYLNDAPMSRRPWLHRPEYSLIDKCLEELDFHVRFSERKHPEEFSSQHLTTLRGMWGVPARNNLFTGREEQLTALHDKLFYDNSDNSSNKTENKNQKNCGIKRTELGGIGGVGKTQLSIEYCHRHFGCTYGFVFMVRAESQASIAQEMRRLALDLGLLGGGGGGRSEKSEIKKKNSTDDNNENDEGDKSDSTSNSLPLTLDDDEIIEIIKRKLSRCRYRWLIVFDNVEDSTIISKYLPRGQLNENFLKSSASYLTFQSEFSRENNFISAKNENENNGFEGINGNGRNDGNLECLGGGHVIITSRTSNNNNKSMNNYSSYSINNINNINNLESKNNSEYSQVRTSSSILLECFNKTESLKFLDSSLQHSTSISALSACNGTSTHSTTHSTHNSTGTNGNSSSLTTSNTTSSTPKIASHHSLSHVRSEMRSEESKSLAVLAERMGYLPLALAMASAYLTRCDVTATEYLNRLDKLILCEDEEEGEEGGEGGDGNDDGRSVKSENSERSVKSPRNAIKEVNDVRRKKKKVMEDVMGANDYSVVSSLSISLDRIFNESEAAFSVLLLLGFLSPDGITKNLVRLLLEVCYFKTKTFDDELCVRSREGMCNSGNNGSRNDNGNSYVMKLIKKNEIETKNNENEENTDNSNGNNHENNHGNRDYSEVLPLPDCQIITTLESDIEKQCITKNAKKMQNLKNAKKIRLKRKRVAITISTITVTFFLLPFRKLNLLPLKEKLGFTLMTFFAIFGASAMIDDITSESGESEENYENLTLNDDKKGKRENEKNDNETNVGNNNADQNKKLIEILQENKSERIESDSTSETNKPVKPIKAMKTVKTVISEESILRETDHVWELLKQFSLLSVRGERMYRVGSIHRLQQSVLRSRNFIIGGIKNVKLQLEKCILAIKLMWKFDIKNVNTWTECGAILNHIQSLVEHVRKYSVNTVVARRFAVILTQAAMYSTEVMSRFDFSQFILENAVVIQNRIGCKENSYDYGIINDSNNNDMNNNKDDNDHKINNVNINNIANLCTTTVNSNNTNNTNGNTQNNKNTKNNFLEEKANATHLLGKVLRIRGVYDKAEKNLKIALKMRILINSSKICDTYHELGVLSLRHHDYSEAYLYLTESLKLKKLLKKDINEERIKNELNYHNEKKDGNRNPVTNEIKEINEITETSEAATLHQLAVIATGEGNYDEAEALLLKALVLESELEIEVEKEVEKEKLKEEENDFEFEFEREEEEDVEEETPRNREKYEKDGKGEKDIENKNKILREIEILKNLIFNNLDKDDSNKNNYNINSNKSQNSNPKSRNAVSRAATLQQLGRVALRKGKLTEAKTRFKDSLTLYLNAYGTEKFSSHINVAAVYHQLGCCLSAMHEFNEASNHFRLALATREIIYSNDNDNNYNSNNSKNNNDNDDDGNNYGNIEIIQEIQALGQSEMMIGKLEAAEKYFLRQFSMCSQALSLNLSELMNENGEINNNNRNNGDGSSEDTTNIDKNDKNDKNNNINGNIINALNVSDIQNHNKINVPLAVCHISPTDQRKHDTYVNSLLFSVYCLKSIANKRKKSTLAGDYSRLAKIIRRVLIRGGKDFQNTPSTDATPENANNTENIDNEKVKSYRSSYNDLLTVTESGSISPGSSTVNRNEDLESVKWYSLFAPILLKTRDDIRSVAILLLKGEVPACALILVSTQIEELKKNIVSYLPSKSNINDVNNAINTNKEVISIEDRNDEKERNKVLYLGLEFSENCLSRLSLILNLKFPVLNLEGKKKNCLVKNIDDHLDSCIDISSCNNMENNIENKIENDCINNSGNSSGKTSQKSPENNVKTVENNRDRIKLLTSSLFSDCDALRSALRELGLKIEDS